MKTARRWAIALALALGACAGGAMGAEMLLDDPATLQPTPFAAMLGPITEAGRVGWACAPERAARAGHSATAAELPSAP